jgi:uncharacterized protein YbjT (DUF2867 family)
MIAVIGASGRSGAALCRALHAAGRPFAPVVRDPARWAATQVPGAPRLAELRDRTALRRALADAETVISCAPAGLAPAILAAAPAALGRLVLMGSTRRFSRRPDAHGDEVRGGEAAFLASGRPGVMLHPTLIYGGARDQNIRRLAALLRRLPVAPLPGGGAARVQPIHQDDVTACLLAALRVAWTGPETLVIAGPEPLPYRAFLTAVAEAAGLRPPPILPVPLPVLRLAAWSARLFPGLPRVTAEEVRRLTEDRAFDIRPMHARLGVHPMPLTTGLCRTFLALGLASGLDVSLG